MGNFKKNSKQLKTSHGKQIEKSALESSEVGNSSVDFLNLSPENLQLAQKVFGIHLTFNSILNFLPGQNLLSLRLVNKFWNEQITKILSRNCDIQIRLHFNSSSNRFYVGSSETENENGTGKTLAQLNKYLKNAGRLFCHNFSIEDRRLENPEMVTFLSLHGKKIKILHLKWLRRFLFDGEKNLKLESLTRLLVGPCPNLEHLQFSGIIRKDTKLFPAENPVILPHLKSFSFSQFFPQISEIIAASPNLNSLSGDLISAVNILTLQNPSRIHLAKKLRITRHETKLEDVEKLADSGTQLKILDLSDPVGYFIFPWAIFTRPNVASRFFATMTKLLNSSKNSLTHIDIGFRREYFHPEVKWPRMENVKSLSAVSMSPQDFVTFPLNFISDVFPNVEKMELNLKKYEDKIWFPESFLNSTVGFLKLEELDVKISSYENEKTLERLNALAPNLEILSATDLHIRNFPLHSNWILGFRKLRTLNLELRMNSNYNCPSNEFSSFLMNFTGLDEETTLKNHNASRSLGSRVETKRIEKGHHENSSILSCKDLQILNLEFSCDSPENSGSAASHRVLDEMLKGFELGLKRMENLKTCCTVKYVKKDKTW